MDQNAEIALVSIPTTILSFVSIWATIYVCVSMYTQGFIPFKCCEEDEPINSSPQTIKKINDEKKHKATLSAILFWMAFTDGVHSIPEMLEWLPQAFPIAYNSNNEPIFWSTNGCKWLAVVQMFFECQSPTWHLILAYQLIYLLLGYKVGGLSNQKRLHYALAIVIPLFATLLPMICALIEGKNFLYYYGEYDTGDPTFDRDCILIHVSYQMVQMGIVQIALLFHYFCLILSLFKKRNNTLAGFSIQYLIIVKKITNFVIVYTVLYMIPVTQRWVSLATGTSPLWLVCGHHWLVASLGLADAIVYVLNKKVTKLAYKKYQQSNISQLLSDNYNSLNLERTLPTENTSSNNTKTETI